MAAVLEGRDGGLAHAEQRRGIGLAQPARQAQRTEALAQRSDIDLNGFNNGTVQLPAAAR